MKTQRKNNKSLAQNDLWKPKEKIHPSSKSIKKTNEKKPKWMKLFLVNIHRKSWALTRTDTVAKKNYKIKGLKRTNPCVAALTQMDQKQVTPSHRRVSPRKKEIWKSDMGYWNDNTIQESIELEHWKFKTWGILVAKAVMSGIGGGALHCIHPYKILFVQEDLQFSIIPNPKNCLFTPFFHSPSMIHL